MLLTTLSLFHVVAGLLSRDQVNTIFDRDAVPGVISCAGTASRCSRSWRSRRWTSSSGSSGPAALTGNQWAICIGLAASLLVVEELVKLVLRAPPRRLRAPAVVTTPALA